MNALIGQASGSLDAGLRPRWRLDDVNGPFGLRQYLVGRNQSSLTDRTAARCELEARRQAAHDTIGSST